MIVSIHARNAFSHFPRFYNLDKGFNNLGVDFIPNYLNDASFGVAIKTPVGRNGNLFHGFYFTAFLESGRGWESYWTQLATIFPRSHNINTYSYAKYGIGFGRQWTLFNSSVLDMNFGLGYFDMSGDNEKVYILPGIFEQGEDQAYFFGSLGLGIGDHSHTKTKDKLALRYGITLDINAILKNSIEAGLLFGNSGKSLWHAHLRYGTREEGQINVTSATSFSNVYAGLQYRHYPGSTLKKEGLYFAGDFTTGHARAEIRKREDDMRWVTHKVLYDPQRITFSMGFTKHLNSIYLIDGYISNAYTFSPGSAAKFYAHPDEATGITTYIGIKLGFLKMKRI